MAAVILPIILVPTLAKTVMVVGAIFSTSVGSGLVARAAQTIHSQASRAPARSFVGASPRQRSNGPISAGTPRARSLHRRLLSMHVASTVSQSAGVAKYLIPVSDTSCVVTHRIRVAVLLLFDASLVVFLLAKVKVANGNRTLAYWEKGILWWSRLYGWVYLPVVGLYMGVILPGSAGPKAAFCYNGQPVLTGSAESRINDNARNLGVSYGLLIVQFILLLGLFVKPMLVHVEGAQSGGAVYKRVVLRNVFCTAGIVGSYAVTTLVVAFAMLRESSENNKSAQVRDVAVAVNGFSTLCLTEIALPIGFRSCMKACSGGAGTGDSTKTIAAGKTTKTDAAAAGTNIKVVVVPVEELPPQAP